MIFQPEEDACVTSSINRRIQQFQRLFGSNILSIDTQPHKALSPRAIGSYPPVLQANAAHTDSAEGGGP